ncbi:MAG: 50S ribosomal protein L32e [Candidatus Micrarchaeota archaeon]|nr:50S ribosomal protein L32e [Candidatus Micrarchaeota archaeon]
MAKGKKRSHPTFARANYGRTSRSRIKDNWRRPRGIDNKKAFKFKYMGCSPSIGYGQPSDVKYTHPQGVLEIFAQTPADLTGAKNVVIRVAAGVGAMKREAIQKLAETMKLKVVNPRKFVPRVAKPKVDAKGKPVEAKKEETKKAETKKTEPVKQTV